MFGLILVVVFLILALVDVSIIAYSSYKKMKGDKKNESSD